MSTENVNIERVAGAVVTNPLPVSASISGTPTVKISQTGTDNDVDVVSSVLPTGAATAARQDTGNTSLGNLDVLLSTRTKPSDQQHVIVDSSASVAVTGPLTDTQLRATAVPVSGTFYQATQPVSIADGSSVVEGTTTDAAVLGNATGTNAAKLRGMNIALAESLQLQIRLNYSLLISQQALLQANPPVGFVPTPELPAFLGGF